jgi:cellobiose phosphorylase
MKKIIIEADETTYIISYLFLWDGEYLYSGNKSIGDYFEKKEDYQIDSSFQKVSIISDEIFEKIKKLNFNHIRKLKLKDFCKKYELEEIMI